MPSVKNNYRKLIKVVIPALLFFVVMMSLFSLSNNSTIISNLYKKYFEGNEILLDHWEISTVFYDSSVDAGRTPLTEINWDASNGGYDSGTPRIIKIQINYKNSNVVQNYAPGELKIEVDNILNKYQTLQLNGSVNVGANDSTHVGYEWDFAKQKIGVSTYSNPGKEQQKYIFTNANTIEIGTTLEGSIQIEYTLTPAPESMNVQSNQFEIEKYDNSCLIDEHLEIQSRMSDKNDTNTINANTLIFNYRREYIHVWEKSPYRIFLTKRGTKLYSEEMFGENPEDYYWVDVSVYYSRVSGSSIPLYLVSNSIIYNFELPEGVIVYDYSTGEVIDNIEELTPSSSAQKYLYFAYPKSIYNAENNNLTVQNTVNLYGQYENLDSREYVNTATLEIKLSDYNYTIPGNQTITKAQNTSAAIYYQGFKNGNTIDWTINPKSYIFNQTYDMIVGDDVLFIKSNDTVRKLEDEEYCVLSASFGNLNTVSSVPYTLYEEMVDIDLYVRKKNQENYELYTSYTGNQRKTYNFTEDEEIVGFYFHFKNLHRSLSPGNIGTKTKITTENIQEQGEIYNYAYIDAYTKNPDGTKVYLTTSSGYSENTALDNAINEYDTETYSRYLPRARAVKNWTYYVVEHNTKLVTGKVKTGTTIQNDEEENFTGSFRVTASLIGKSYNVSNYTAFPYVYTEENTFKGYKIYDLLPYGMDIKSTKEEIINSTVLVTGRDSNNYNGSTNSWAHTPYASFYKLGETTKLTTAQLNQIGKDNSSVEIIKNWNNTRRTMIIITGDFTSEKLLFFGSAGYSGYYLGYTYTFNYSISYDAVGEFGTVWTNTCYVDFLNKSPGETLMNTITDDGSTNGIPDINSNGSTTDSLSKATASATFSSVISTNQDVQVSVQSNEENFSTGRVDTQLDSEYDYKLRVRTGSNDITNLVIYSNLERFTKDANMEFIEANGGRGNWYGEFMGVDTSYAESKGYTVRVYYSENNQPQNLKNDNSWQLYTDSVDKSKVKSLAFQYLDSSGNPAIIPSNSMTYVLVNMKSPNDEYKTFAYNGCWTEWNALDPITGDPVDFITGINSNIVRVGLPTSIEPEDISINIDKYWIDSNNALGKRPETITVQIIPNGDLTKAIDVPLGSTDVDNNNASHWYKTVSVPKIDGDGETITYTIREGEIILENGYKYTPEITDNSITNVLTKEIELKKVWKDNNNSYLTRPGSVTYQVKQNNNPYKEVTITGDYSTNEWTKTITVPVYDSSNNEYTYTVEETSVNKYTSNCENYTCTNTLSENEMITITKVWIDRNNEYSTRPNNITVHLLQNNINYQNVILSPTSWAKTVTVPKYDSNGVKYNYTITEDEVDEYGLVAYDQNNYKITNTLKEKINLVITKTWIDDNNSNNTRPDELTITLLRDGNFYKNLVLSGDTNVWTITEEVDKYDDNQRKYVYSIQELNDSIKDEYSNVTYGEDDLSVTNKLDKSTNLTVTKKWNDQNNKYLTRPNNVRINLLQNGEIYRELTITKENNWIEEINNIPVYDNNGAKYDYTIEEININPKYGNITYDQTTLEVTNELTEEPKVTLYFTVMNGYIDPTTQEIKYDEFGLKEILEKYKINIDDEYIFDLRLENVDTGKEYEGKLSTQGVLQFDNIPYGTYKVEEQKDILFEFFDMLSISDVDGVEFTKEGNIGYITIRPTGENIIFGAKIINKIEALINNPQTSNRIFISIGILMMLCMITLYVKKKRII